jgi:hypothetical protein
MAYLNNEDAFFRMISLKMSRGVDISTRALKSGAVLYNRFKMSRETDFFVVSSLTTLMIEAQCMDRKKGTQISALAFMFTIYSWDTAEDSVRGLRGAMASREKKLKSSVEKTTFNYFIKTYLSVVSRETMLFLSQLILIIN